MNFKERDFIPMLFGGGNAVGEPLLGGIDNADNLAQLQKNIDAALAADQK